MITTDLPTARRLRENGFNVPSLLTWVVPKNGYEPRIVQTRGLELVATSNNEYIPAWVAEEVLNELPKRITWRAECDAGTDSVARDRVLKIFPSSADNWGMEYDGCFTVWKDTLANCAAELWIYLSTHKLL